MHFNVTMKTNIIIVCCDFFLNYIFIFYRWHSSNHQRGQVQVQVQVQVQAVKWAS